MEARIEILVEVQNDLELKIVAGEAQSFVTDLEYMRFSGEWKVGVKK